MWTLLYTARGQSWSQRYESPVRAMAMLRDIAATLKVGARVRVSRPDGVWVASVTR